MTRGDARELAVHLIYSREFTGDDPHQIVSQRLVEEYYAELAEENEIYTDRPSNRQVRYIDSVVAGVAEQEQTLNDIIGKFSIGWDVKRISRLARAILQLAVYEILYVEDVPEGVAVSEAVRLVKKYDADSSAFVNGILGSFVRSRKEPDSGEPEDTAATEEV